MKLIVISDIHGNLEALNKVLEYIDKLKGEKRVVCLGDIVGYGPNPAAAAARLIVPVLILFSSALPKQLCPQNYAYTNVIQ